MAFGKIGNIKPIGPNTRTLRFLNSMLKSLTVRTWHGPEGMTDVVYKYTTGIKCMALWLQLNSVDALSTLSHMHCQPLRQAALSRHCRRLQPSHPPLLLQLRLPATSSSLRDHRNLYDTTVSGGNWPVPSETQRSTRTLPCLSSDSPQPGI